ncbi:hypothetical protein AVEN_231604-1, partial [Araneus ventricosus]
VFTPLKYLTVPCAQKRLAPYVRVSQSEHEFPFFISLCVDLSQDHTVKNFIAKLRAVTGSPGSVHCPLKYILPVKHSDRDFMNVAVNLWP